MIAAIECGQTEYGPLCFQVVMADGRAIKFTIYSDEVIRESLSGIFRATYTSETQQQIIARIAARKLREALNISHLPTEVDELLEAAL